MWKIACEEAPLHPAPDPLSDADSDRENPSQSSENKASSQMPRNAWVRRALDRYRLATDVCCLAVFRQLPLADAVMSLLGANQIKSYLAGERYHYLVGSQMATGTKACIRVKVAKRDLQKAALLVQRFLYNSDQVSCVRCQAALPSALCVCPACDAYLGATLEDKAS